MNMTYFVLLNNFFLLIFWVPWINRYMFFCPHINCTYLVWVWAQWALRKQRGRAMLTWQLPDKFSCHGHAWFATWRNLLLTGRIDGAQHNCEILVSLRVTGTSRGAHFESLSLHVRLFVAVEDISHSLFLSDTLKNIYIYIYLEFNI